MASKIVPPSPSVRPSYRLSEATRQAIIAQSPAAQTRAEIERQRVAFTQKFGNEFGLI